MEVNTNRNGSESARIKECRECGFRARCNSQEMCGSCDWKEERKLICKECENKVKMEDAVECDACQYWHHRECTDIGKRMFEELVKNKSVMWYCKGCKKEVGKSLEENKLLRDSVNLLKEKNDNMREDFKMINEENEKRDNKLRNYEKKITEAQVGRDRVNQEEPEDSQETPKQQGEDLLTYLRRDKGSISGTLAVIGRAISAGPITSGALEILPLSRLR